jgi:hypothetical protein
MKLLMFAEAAADFRTASALLARQLAEMAAPGVVAHEWVRDTRGEPYFDIHDHASYIGRYRLARPTGRFGRRSGHYDTLMAQNAILVARHHARIHGTLDAAVIVRDMDDQGDERRASLAQGVSGAPFPVVLGCADPTREAWVLAGFEPENDEERARLADLRRDLGFSPCEQAHRLSAKKEAAKKSPKRVLAKLTSGDRDREERCWTDTPLTTLRTRGQQSGLRAFLDEVGERLREAASRSGVAGEIR